MNIKFYSALITSLLLFFFLQNSIAQIPQAGLVGYYKLDGDAVDSGPLGNDGVIQGLGTVVATTDRLGEADKAMLFTEASISLGNSPEVNFTDSISVAAWVNTTLMDGWSGLITKWDNSTNSGFFLGVNSTGNGVRLNLSNMPDPVEGAPIVLGEWMHIAATYDGDTARLYYNGELADMKAHNLSIPQNSNDFILGSQTNGTGTHWGFMDNVLIYNRGLSRQEVEAIYAAETSSTRNAFLDRSVVLSPNPTNSILNIKNDSGHQILSYTFCNASGMKLKAGAFHNELDLCAQPPGVYYLILSFEDGSVTKKVIKF